jgi:hypothetical protein
VYGLAKRSSEFIGFIRVITRVDYLSLICLINSVRNPLGHAARSSGSSFAHTLSPDAFSSGCCNRQAVPLGTPNAFSASQQEKKCRTKRDGVII